MRGEHAEPIPPTDPFTRRLMLSASRGVISQGELREGFLTQRAAAAAQRSAVAAEHGNLSERVAAVEAKLEALIYEPPAPAKELPVAKALRPISQIIPFADGARHG